MDKSIGDKIREYDLDGVKVDEDYKRYYPYETLASKVLGFTGGDNQGIIGLEVIYEEYLKGKEGTILAFNPLDGGIFLHPFGHIFLRQPQFLRKDFHYCLRIGYLAHKKDNKL